MMKTNPLEVTRARKLSGLSQSEFALVLGVTQSQVSDFERGLRSPKAFQNVETVMAAIATAAAKKEKIEAAKREAIERVTSDFEIPKMPADAGRRFAVANPKPPNVQRESPGPKRKSLRTILLPNSSPVPNWFFDEVLSNPEVPHATRSVFLFMLRKTVGWDNEVEELSLTAIQYGSAVSRHTAIHAIRVICESWGLFEKSRGQKGQGSSVYEIAGLREDEFTDRFSLCDDIYGTCHSTAKQLRESPCTSELRMAQMAIDEANDAKRHAEYLKRRGAMTAPQ
jgi:transcriptional regulator with XRE-family HTH domain